MEKLKYIEEFEKLGFGLFVHFGLYSIVGQGEWYYDWNPNADKQGYEKLTEQFLVNEAWAKDLVKAAKRAGCKYITLTTRHHDGFSLYDTCGLNSYDAPHSACGRDLIREFVDACREGDIVPFFYHTLLDWREKSYQEDFSAYIDYLVKSIEILCTNYGQVGGFWFDGMWDKPNDDWQENRLYGTIRKYQPEAMIINNTGLSECGKVGHVEIDSVTFERGKPAFVDNSDKYRAGEMCQVLNDHWGYAKNDCNYKSINELIENLIDCRLCNCNFLLNTGLRGDGTINPMDGCMLDQIGVWINANQGIIYNAKKADIQAENAELLFDGTYYYAILKSVAMRGDPNVAIDKEEIRTVKLLTDKAVQEVCWLDNGRKVEVVDNKFQEESFCYGNSMAVRIAKIEFGE